MDFSNVHILLCDHDPSTCSETLSLLRKCSYKVTPLQTARQAVDVLKSEGTSVDVVLTDVELPKDKGFRMLKYILKQDSLDHIAVVVMSEHDEMAIVAKCLSLGAVDYLVKPLRLNEVMNLWTHMWRRRRTMKLPDREVGIMTVNGCSNVQKPIKTADLLSGYKISESGVPATERPHRIQQEEESNTKVELSLRLSLNYSTYKLPAEDVHAASMLSQPYPVEGKTSAFSAYMRSCSQQPDEQSGTNACSSSSSPSKRSKHSSECITHVNQESVSGAPADASFSSPKEVSVADETRPADMEGQLCDRSSQPFVEHLPHFFPPDERTYHGGHSSPAHLQGFQPCYTYMGMLPSNAQPGDTTSVPEAATAICNLPVNSPPGQPLSIYYPESGMACMPPVQNVFPWYPVAHLAVPVVNFPTWPALMRPSSAVGGKLIQAERREAALSKFRMKRKGRCFEKRIRYASRKTLAEQRPRIRGQFVKRSVLLESMGTQDVSEDEGEADDEQGCSELDNQSSPDCVAINNSGG